MASISSIFIIVLQTCRKEGIQSIWRQYKRQITRNPRRKVNLKNYIPEGKYYQHIADIRQVGYARAFLDGVEAKRDQVRALNENNPQICDDDITKDIRFRAGAVWAFNWVLALPDVARDIVLRTPDDI